MRPSSASASHKKFAVSADELRALMELKSAAELNAALEERFGGLDALVNKLETNIQNGIHDDNNNNNNNNNEEQRRIKHFGRNHIPPKKAKTFLGIAVEALQEPIIIMLIVCAVVTFALSFYNPSSDSVETVRVTSASSLNLDWIEGVAIIVAVLVVVLVSSFNDWSKERQFRGLQTRLTSEQRANVCRRGHIVQIDLERLCVGDVCLVKYGDLVPADGLVVHASDLKVDESSLTGETDLVSKGARVDDGDAGQAQLAVYAGTHVMEGSGKFLVLAVGMHSQKGVIMSLIGASQDDDDDDDDDDHDDDEEDEDDDETRYKEPSIFNQTNQGINKKY